MNNEIKSVFVIESGNYVEIAYQEVLERRSSDSSYKSRKFILVEKHIMELSEENYRAYYKEKRRVKYVKEREREVGVFSYDALADRGVYGEELIADQEEDVCDLAVSQTLVENLRNSLSLLTDRSKNQGNGESYRGRSLQTGRRACHSHARHRGKPAV